MAHQKLPLKRLPYRYYYFPTIGIALLGLALSGYLAITHYKNFSDLTYTSFCAISKTINCDTVAQSPWSVLFGLPVAYWGMIGFLLFLFLAARSYWIGETQIASSWAVIFIVTIVYCLCSLGLGLLSSLKIGSYCILCIAVYIANFSLFIFCLLIYRRFGEGAFRHNLVIGTKILFFDRIGLTFLSGLLGSIILLLVFLPPYWKFTVSSHADAISTGVTEDGNYWIGAQNPQITIEEYSDYQCFQCAKMHQALRLLVERYHDRIRLVHRHYPLDHEFNKVLIQEPFHIGAGKMSLLAIYAGTKGKFWQMNDALYRLARTKQPFSTRLLAQEVGLDFAEVNGALEYKPYKEKLIRDIWQGLKLRITATPSYVINGKVYHGNIPQNVLDSFIQQD